MKALIGFITLAAAAVLPAAASSGYSPAKGELSATLHAMPAATSRAQVQTPGHCIAPGRRRP